MSKPLIADASPEVKYIPRPKPEVERLRERVEKAIAEMRDLAKDMHNPARGETAYAEAICYCADLVQAALEGE